jgi:hypothetical protein
VCANRTTIHLKECKNARIVVISKVAWLVIALQSVSNVILRDISSLTKKPKSVNAKLSISNKDYSANLALLLTLTANIVIRRNV